MTDSSESVRLPPHLQPDRQVYVVISTGSGSGGASDYYTSKLQPILGSHSINHSVHTTTSASSIIELISSKIIIGATKGGKQTIILLSGDGGPADFVNTLSTLLMRDTYDNRIGSIFVKPVLVLFPLGTANALAWSSGIAQDPIQTMLNGRACPLPQFEARFSPGSKLVTNEGKSRQDIGMNYDNDAATVYGDVVFSWGLHASLVSTSDTAEYRKHGVERFKMAAAKLLEEAHQYHARVQIRKQRYGDWEDLTYPKPTPPTSSDSTSPDQVPTNTHTYILSTLVSNLEQTFRISPSTTPMTSTLRLVAVRPPTPPTSTATELTRILTLAYKDGAHVDDESVLYTEIDGLRIEFDEADAQWRQVCVDGKIVEVGGDGGWAEVNMLPAMGMDGRRVVELVVPN